MKTSRSKKYGLGTLVEDGNADTRAIETSSKSSGAFTSFFGRSKRSKSPTPNLVPSGSCLEEELVTRSTQEIRRNSLNSRHYKTLSRSMNDLGTVLSEIEIREPLQGKVVSGGQFSPRKSLDAQSLSPQLSPTKRKIIKKDSLAPFPLATISISGWLNKRGSRKEHNMKLYRVYLRESKLYAYKPPADVGIRAFHLPMPVNAKLTTPSGTKVPGEEFSSDVFTADARRILYDTTSSSDVKLYQYAQRVQEVSEDLEHLSMSDSNRLILLTDTALVLCRKASHDSAGNSDLWCLDLELDWSTVQYDLARSDHYARLVIQYAAHTRSFTNSFVDCMEALLENCNAQRSAHNIASRTPDDTSTLGDHLQSASSQPAVISQELFSVRQIVRNENGKIVRGTVAGLCRQILLEKSTAVESRTLSSILLSTIGLWASAQQILQELCAQLDILAESATRTRPAYIVRTLVNTAASLLLDSKNVEGLLKLIGFANIEEQDALKDELWAKRTTLLAVITMDISTLSMSKANGPDPSWTMQFQSLSKNGLQGDAILAIPANLFAAQLHSFHYYYLKRWDPALDQALFFNTASNGASRNPLIFEPKRMHFLTYTILNHVLNLDSAPISHTQRAAVTTQWILIGMMLKRLGDMAGWLAAVMAICAPAIVRLKEMWSIVEDRLQLVVEKEWSPVMRDLFRRTIDKSATQNSAHVLAPDADGLSTSSQSIVPFYGDLCDAIEENRREVIDDAHETSASIDIEALQSGEDLLNTALESYRLFVLEHKSEGLDDDDADRETTIPVFQDCFKQLNSVPLEILDVCSPLLLEASLKCERGRQDNLKKCDSSDLIGSSTNTPMPLLFTDQLPGYRLFDASILLDIHDPVKRSRLLENPTQSGTNLRRLNSFPPSQQPSNHVDVHEYLDQTTRARAAASVSQWKVLKHVKDLAGVSDQLIHFAAGNLILKYSVDHEDSNQKRRPQSVLVEERKRTSTISRRNSLQTFEQSTFEADEDLVIKPNRYLPNKSGVCEVVIKAATLDTLIDLLVFDIRDLKYLELITTTTNGHAKSTNFELDRPEYLQTFLVSHRSYCSASSLMKALHLRLDRALVVSSVNKSVFPAWSVEDKQSVMEQTLDWQLLEKTYTGIYEVVSTWLNLAPADFTGSPELLALLNDFLILSRAQLTKLEQIEKVSNRSNACQELCASYLRRMSKQILRVHHRPQSWANTHLDEQRLEIYEPLNISRFSVPDDVYTGIMQLDSIVESVLQCVTLEDWMQCYELFEIQKSNDGGFFRSITDAVPLESEVKFQTVLDLLASTPFGNSTSTIYDEMPLPVRSLIRLRHSITSWTVQQVADPLLTGDERVRNIELFLTVLSTCAVCMSPLDIKVTAPGKTTTQTIPSFIAGAVATGLLSPESRMYSQSWLVVAQHAGRPDACGSVIDLVPVKDPAEACVPIVPCLAWLCERMLEVACYIPDISLESAELFNFDKRRYVYNLLSNLDLVRLSHSQTSILDEIDNPFLFILSPVPKPLDRRALRAAATKESQSQRGTRSMKVFTELVQQELEKLRREMRHRDVIEKQARESRKVAQRRLQEASRMEVAKRPSNRARYGMNSLLRAVRPLSVAIGGNWTTEKSHSIARVVSPQDLPAECHISRGTKPALTIDLVHASCHVVDKQEHIFRIGTEDGMDTYFQAPSHGELEQWVRVITIASTDGAMKRRTMIREDAELELAEDSPQFSPRNSMVTDIISATFGVELGILVRRDGCSIPRIATLLMDEIERRALSEVGIYRISGSLSTVTALKRAFDSGKPVDLNNAQWEDVNAIAGAFKLWLRELPEPLMTYKLYDQFLATLEVQDYSAKFLALKELVHQLPVPNFSMLKRLIEHLEKITDYEATNHMYAHNLAIIFGPNILQPIPSNVSFAASMNDLGKVQTIIRNIILQCHWIFSTEDDIEELTPTAVKTASAPNLTVIEETDADMYLQ